MRLVCTRPGHGYPDTAEVFDMFGGWLFHEVLHGSLRFLREPLIRRGFIDCECEGGILFWRWDRENARLAAWIRDFDRKQWERKRDKARARWGEGAA